MRKALPAAVAAALLACLLASGAGATGHAWTQTTVATGLDSPRGMTVEPDGTVLVAEAGHGGDVCTPTKDCIGTSARISKLDPSTGSVTPVVTGLFSNASAEGITGIDGISAADGRLAGAITLAPQIFAGLDCTGQPADCSTVLAAEKAQIGQAIQFTDSGTWKALAGVGSNDFGLTAADASLSDSGPNANPYAVLPVPGGTWVADSGANLVDFVTANGDLHVASRIAAPAPGGFPGDGVPTCLAILRGNLYVGDLAGRLWERNGAFAPTAVPVTAGGRSLLQHVTGCVSDGKDHLYLVNMWGTPGPPIPAGPGSAAGTGSVVELTRGGSAQVIASGLDFPNGIALAKDGSLYVTVDSLCTATGTPLPFCGKGGQAIRLQP